MKIQVGGLSEGRHLLHFEAAGPEVGLGEEFQGIVRVEASIDKAPRQVFLQASVETEGTFACDRCLRPIGRPVSASYRMFYVWDPADADRLDPAEVQVVQASLTVVDITEDVRQTVMLAVPLKVLCSESCQGLCPYCGKDLNDGPCGCQPAGADGRWEKLRSLYN